MIDKILLKKIGLIALGGVAGGILGYLTTSLIIDKLTKEKEIFETKSRGWIKESDWKLTNPTDEMVEDSKPLVNSLETVMKTDYTKFSGVDKAKANLEDLVKPYKENDDFVIISLVDYAERDNSFMKEIVYYYEEDSAFANTNEDLIDAPESLFGPNIHLHFGEKSDDPDVVYLRNNKNSTIYEILRIHSSYSVSVLGNPEPEVKSKPRKRHKTEKKVVEEENDEEEGE